MFLSRSQIPFSYRGFTLVELVVALLVLSVGLLGLASLQAMALRQQQQLLQAGDQADVAVRLLEQQRSQPQQRPPSSLSLMQSHVEIRLPASSATARPYLLRSRL